MNRYKGMKKVIVFATISLLVTACANDSIIDNKIKGDRIPLTVSSITIDAPVTKATTSISTENNTFGAIVDGSSSYGYPQKKVLQFKYSSGKWDYVNQDDVVMLNDNPITFVAYYPAVNSYIDGTKDPTDVVLTTHKLVGDDDFYTKLVQADNVNSSVDLKEMKHVYSQITFLIKRSDIYLGTGVVSKIRLVNEGFCTTGKYNMLTGVYTPDAGAGAFEYDPQITSLQTYNSSDESTAAKTSILVLPISEIKTSIVVKITLDDKEFSTEIPKESLPKLLPGVNYQIGLGVNGIKLFVQDAVKEEDWKNGEETTPVYPQP